jgi:Flp pilus assembly protein TadG
MLKNRFHLPRKEKMEQGQSIVLIALAFIGLVAFIGLAIDTGILFIGYGHLRRATDAAALAAASQFRENYTSDQLNNSATEFLRLNGVDLDNVSATVYTCEGGTGGVDSDPSLCQTGSSPKRKLVRVKSSSSVKFSFLPILGITDATITSDANAEAATLDLVLVIDNSESMAKNEATNQPVDPSWCNNPANHDPCEPFTEVKESSKSLAQKILDKTFGPTGVPYSDEDRIAIIEFSNGWQQGGNNQGTYVVPINNSVSGWSNNYADVAAAIDSLQVYDPGVTCTQDQIIAHANANNLIGTCRFIQDDGTYGGLQCPLNYRTLDPNLPPDASTCPTTNIGGGLLLASNQFKNNARPESVWVEVLLTDGVPNATCAGDAVGTTCWPATHGINPLQTDQSKPDKLPIQFCPDIPVTRKDPNTGQYTVASYQNQSSPFCLGNYATTHHPAILPDGSTNPAYDPQDYAIDNAYYAACDPLNPSAGCSGTKGQGAIIFTIGLGPEVATLDRDGYYRGQTILRKIAAIGDDGNPATDPCAGVSGLTSCGNYYYAPQSNALGPIFDAIAGRIFTRITK